MPTTDAIEQALPISVGERLAGLAMGILTGLGIGSGVGVGIYTMVISKVAAGGMGLAVAGISAPLLIVGVSVGSGLVGLFFGYRAYRDHIKFAEELNILIDEQKKEKKAKEELYQATLYKCLLALAMRYQKMYPGKELKNADLTEVQALLSSNYKPCAAYFLAAFTQIEKHKRLNELPHLWTNLDELTRQEITQPLFEKLMQERPIDPSKITSTSMGPALYTGLRGLFGTVATVTGVAWGLAALITGTFTAVAITTPIIGWSILGGAILLGVAVGAAYAYYKYMNTQREALRNNLQAEVKHMEYEIKNLKDEKGLLKKPLELQQRDIPAPGQSPAPEVHSAVAPDKPVARMVPVAEIVPVAPVAPVVVNDPAFVAPGQSAIAKVAIPSPPKPVIPIMSRSNKQDDVPAQSAASRSLPVEPLPHLEDEPRFFAARTNNATINPAASKAAVKNEDEEGEGEGKGKTKTNNMKPE